MSNIKMVVSISRVELLEKLKANAAAHAKIVQEARVGYVEKAKKALSERLDEIKDGRVVALAFHLNPPTDYSEVYRTVIGMLEMTKDETIQLTSDEFRQLVQDEWDWTDQFLASNRVYSGTAARESMRKGL